MHSVLVECFMNFPMDRPTKTPRAHAEYLGISKMWWNKTGLLYHIGVKDLFAFQVSFVNKCPSQ